MEWSFGVRTHAVLSVSFLAAAAAQSSPEQALTALKAGNERFTKDQCIVQQTHDRVRRTLAEGQKPFAIVLDNEAK